jgi:hypothetical protein
VLGFANYESITVANTAIGFTSASITGTAWTASSAFCSLETAQIRWRADGTNPTSSEGHLMNVGDTVTVSGYNSISNFKAIRTGATSGVLKCSYE